MSEHDEKLLEARERLERAAEAYGKALVTVEDVKITAAWAENDYREAWAALRFLECSASRDR
jgi:hypothetical protein